MATPIKIPSAQRQRLVTASCADYDVPGKWDILSGGGVSYPATKVWPAGEKRVVRIPGPEEPKAITLSRMYVPSRDGALGKRIRENPRSLWQVTSVGLEENGDPSGDQVTYTDCSITEINMPSADSSSNEAARIEIVLEPAFITG